MKPSEERRQQKREQKRKEAFENGLCTTCYARDPYPAHKSCEHCLLQGRQSREKHRTRRLRATHADSHRLMCSTCLAREPMLGRKQCNHCQEYYRNRLRRRRAANTASKSPMCSNCFTRDPAPGRKYCEHCRKISIMAHSRGMRTTHVTSKSAMCSRCCSRCPAPGRKLCKRCAEMYHSHWERRKAANSEVESPKCTSCFIRYPISGRKRCATCRQAINGQGRAYRQKRRAENPEGCRTCFIRIRSPGFASCAQCREKGYAQKGDRDKRSIGMQTQSKAIRILLSPNTPYPLTSAIQMVMNAWYNNPHATMIVDIEYSSSAFSIFGPDAVFQIAIADARGDWIVPLTTINHRLPKRTLFERAHLLGWTEDRFKYEKAAIKFYGVANDNETEGLTWEEVGRLLKRHTEIHGTFKTFIEWGRSYGDYRCLHAGLEKVGQADLLPRPPIWEERPLAWWSTLRDDLGVKCQLDLSLSMLFRGLFPEDERLTSRAHNADADVQMTSRIVESYFQRVRGLHPTQKITKFIQTKKPKWRRKLEFPTGTFS